MKYTFLIILFTISIAAKAQISKLLPEKPSPIQLVNDYTQTLTESQVEILEQRLMAFRAATTNEIAVVVLPTINEYAIEDVALDIFRKWGIGRKNKNNGAILLVIKNDHKLRIQTGYGLEGSLTDVQCAHIMQNTIKPAFKNGDFYKGLDDGTMEIIRAIEPSYVDSLNNVETTNIYGAPVAQDSGTGQANYSNDYQNTQSQGNSGGWAGWVILMMFGFVGIILAILKKFSKASSDSSNNYSSSDSYSSSSDSSSGDSAGDSGGDSGGGDFGGGDSGGGGSSDGW